MCITKPQCMASYNTPSESIVTFSLWLKPFYNNILQKICSNVNKLNSSSKPVVYIGNQQPRRPTPSRVTLQLHALTAASVAACLAWGWAEAKPFILLTQKLGSTLLGALTPSVDRMESTLRGLSIKLLHPSWDNQVFSFPRRWELKTSLSAEPGIFLPWSWHLPCPANRMRCSCQQEVRRR